MAGENNNKETKQENVSVICKECKYGYNFFGRGGRKSTFCNIDGKIPVKMQQTDTCPRGEKRCGL